MVELEGVDFSYGRSPVLAGVTLGLAAGELACVVGPNGAGKSTLVRLIAGLSAPQRGRVRVFGVDPARARRRDLARRLAVVPQSYRVAFPFRAVEVVLLGRTAHAGRLAFDSERDRAAAARAMERCDVLDLAERRFDELSGGEQRRVLLAQAMAQEAELILLDEPTSSLDPAHAIALFEALRGEGAAGRTALVVTHDLNLAARFADRLLLFHRGRLVGDGPPLEVLGSAAASEAFAVTLHVGHLPGGALPYAVPG
jgi:iron complex transport system ATP-binding protein